MDFEFSADQEMLRDSVRRFLADKAPIPYVRDAYDNDGIYLLGIGDVFIPRAKGDNGATIETIHAGKTAVNVYVDDDQSGCTGGNNGDGPAGVAPCVGSMHPFKL